MEQFPPEILEQIWKHIPYPVREISNQIDNLINPYIWLSSESALEYIDNNFDNLVQVFPSQPELFEMVVRVILDNYIASNMNLYTMENYFNINDVYDLVACDPKHQNTIKAHRHLRVIFTKIAKEKFGAYDLFPAGRSAWIKS